jgi:hypothetical protein
MPRRSREERLALLTESYRSILGRYEKIERLSAEQKRVLRDRGAIRRVNEILERKREILREIRDEEGRVTGDREWWKKARRSLPSEHCRELLSLLDAISRKIERTFSLEAECRTLLERAVAWGRHGAATPPPSSAELPSQTCARGADAAGSR